MKKELNISEILKGKPKGVRLYSPIFSDCTFSFIQGVTDAICVIANNNREFFDYKGLYSPTGERQLFPSKLMRNWSKFQWKKGDVLVSNDGGTEVIFDKWYDDTYTSFYCKHYLNSEDENNIKYNEAFLCTTERYSLEDKDATQTYINTIEERLNGKLNRETLEIEKTHPEFKDGDIVVTDAVPSMCYSKCIFILKGDLNIGESRAHFYIFYNINNDRISFDELDTTIKDCNVHLATDSEKQQLFDAIAKEGKAWDSEKKMIVDLKHKIEFKPFDKVLARDTEDSTWCADFFSHIDEEYRYACVGATWDFCIPYNEEMAKLIGTTDNWEG